MSDYQRDPSKTTNFVRLLLSPTTRRMRGERQKLEANIRMWREVERGPGQRKHKAFAALTREAQEAEYLRGYGEAAPTTDLRSPSQRWVEWLLWAIRR